jgi:hypothetical protein
MTTFGVRRAKGRPAFRWPLGGAGTAKRPTARTGAHTLAIQATLSRGGAGGTLASSVDGLLELQADAGNAAVVSLLAGAAAPKTEDTPPPDVDGQAPADGGEHDVDTSEFTATPSAATAVLASKPSPLTPPGAAPAVAAKRVPVDRPAPSRVVAFPQPARPAAATAAATESAAAPTGEVVIKPAPAPPPLTYGAGEVPDAPPPPPGRQPQDDVAFAESASAGAAQIRAAKRHPTGKQASAEAQGAARPPGNDELAQAKTDRVGQMALAKPKGFDEDAFTAAVDAALAKAAPHNLSEAGDLRERTAGMKDTIGGQVSAGKKTAAGDVAAKTAEAPDPGVAVPKPVTPMKAVSVPAPGGVRASGAMPAPAPNEQLDLRHGPAQVDQEMADAGVTEQQLAQSNEPEFTEALDAKKAGEEQAKQAPGQVRSAEAATLGQASADAAGEEKAAVGGAQGDIAASIGRVTGAKTATQSKDEQKRKEVADGINRIFDTTKSDVEAILNGLDEQVDTVFTQGEGAIREAFTDDWNARLDAYKDRRYSGWRGKYRWVRDKFKGLPDEANELFAISRAAYEQHMHNLVRRIGKLVAGELDRATKRIEKGRQDVAAYVKSLKGDLARYGREAATDIGDKFSELDSSVKEKFDDLTDTLAKKYAESRKAVDDEITEAQEANRGLIDKAIDKVKGVVRVIKQLKDLVLTVLQKVAEVIGSIIAHPIRFLENFVGAVKEGIGRFSDRILEHLKKGLMGWLLGQLDVSGIEIPETFDLMGMLKLVLGVLGLTWANIRQRFVKKVGEKGVAALESGADIVQKMVVKGPIVLWDMLLERVSTFEDTVLGGIKDFVVEKLVRSGITFLISLLNPVAAFIKACKMIYDVIMFFVEKGSQIKEFIDTVIDSVGDVARGVTGGVAQKIEDALARLLPLAISFLASILGIGGIGEKVQSIIEHVRAPINKAIDFVVNTVVKVTGPIWRAASRGFERARHLYESGKAKVKGVAGDVKSMILGGNRARAGTAGAGGTKPASALISERDTGPTTQSFQVHGFDHELALSKNHAMTIASQPRPLEAFLAETLAEVDRTSLGADEKARARSLAATISAMKHALQVTAVADDRPTLMRAITSTIKELVDLVGQPRGRGPNVAYCEYDLSGLGPGNLASLSGWKSEKKKKVRMFEPGSNIFFQTLSLHRYELADPRSKRIDHRTHDSELKILEWLTHSLTRDRPRTLKDGFLGRAVYRDIHGSVRMVSEFEVCGSCAFAIGQFRRMFPNVVFIIDSNAVAPRVM